MQTGNIGVKTENIFPVIKKFLYSDQEIFLREIISNAVDATQKLKALASTGEFKGELGDLTIKVEIDKKKKTLTVRDRGIGMSAEEVDKYINQIAFSGAEEFIAKFKTQSEAEAANIIGHFGLGFYSAFMVSSKVSLISKSCKEEGANGVIWECDGSPEYTMNEIPKGDRGTDVILYISDDDAEFLEEDRIRELLNKYCKFLPIPIQFGTRKVQEEIEGETDKDGKPKTKEVEKPWIINDVAPLWKKAPTDIKDEEYNDFYHVLYPMNFGEPLFHIHLNVDYPFNLTGILYFPKVKNRYEFQRNKIQLYCNEVFVTDSVEGNPDANFEDMSMDFMDIRKRIYTYPEMGSKAYFVAIPTSSGTGSEVTPFAIITDKETGIKWPLADYQLLPNMAIVDTDNMMSSPKGLTCASGIDVMTHAIEAYVSMMASDYTDPLATKAGKHVFDYLPRAYRDGNDVEARDHMANASCLAGMAFANAFLGLNHSMAHKLGAFHHLPHGIANAVILTTVMRYNAEEVPTKMGTFPQYEYPHALARYAEFGRACGCTGKDDKEVFEDLIAKLEQLKKDIEIKPTIRDYGVDEKYFLDTLDDMVEQAFNDQCTGTNPRYPLMSEIKELYLECYYGKDYQK